MQLKAWQTNFLSIMAVILGGYVLFNLAFLLYALLVRGYMSLLGLSEHTSPPGLTMVIFMVLILIVSWIALTSKLPVYAKATVLTMPLMVVLVAMGIALYQRHIILILGIGCVLLSAVVVWLRYKKLSWLYYVATGYVALSGLSIIIFNIQI